MTRFRRLRTARVVLALLAAGLTTARAELRLPALIGDGMVLQREARVNLWGWDAPGQAVAVSFNGQEAAAAAGEDGLWTVQLGPMPAGGPYALEVRGSRTVKLDNVMVGEVWVCAGQSNMGWPLERLRSGKKDAASADLPELRFFTVPRTVAHEPQLDAAGRWEVCSPETALKFSAVGFFFGRNLHRELQVPIGLIAPHWGGTPAEAWTPRQALAAKDSLAPLNAAYAEAAASPSAGDPKFLRTSAGVLYDAMIAPLVRYTIRGVIWYQGENNIDRAQQYQTLFPTLIEAWRHAWDQGDFPFYFVQLANYEQRRPQPGRSAWAALREAQAMTLALPNTGMAVAIDLGEADNIHPHRKEPVGDRLARIALARSYSREDLPYSGPVLQSIKREEGRLRIAYAHTHGGLKTADGAPEVRGFDVADSQGNRAWATAAIDGNTVVVTCGAIPHPVEVRYGWATNPDINLANGADLPAAPFRAPVP